jgi:hypothetical protein
LRDWHGEGERWNIINTGKGGYLIRCSNKSNERGFHLSHCFANVHLERGNLDGERYIIYVHKGLI